MYTNPTLFVLADDVTGAADCAARCKGAGLPATILIQPTDSPLPAGAVAFSSDSRFLPPPQAAERVQTLFRALQQVTQAANAIWYKKIDSTLRGNIGAELAAMMTLASPVKSRPCAVIAPAFPAQGRGLVDGYLVYDQAAAQSLSLPKLIAEQTALPQALIGLATVRAGVTELTRHLQAQYAAGAHLFIADALTEADLQTLYQAAQIALPQALFCGSAGLMGVIAAALVAAQGGKPPPPEQPPTIPYPMLAVVGSGSVMAHRQLTRLRQLAKLDLYEVDPGGVDGLRMVAGSGNNTRCALHLPAPAAAARLEGETARQYAATLGAAALDQIRQRHPRTLLLVGGDTAFHLLHLLGITALSVEAELFPGMPLTTGIAADGQRYQIILKAGNHGDEETLVTLFTWSQ
ncbi:MAG: four-carbon acid sugar kinase family protein [Caldilinea sp. CFX5]|nr:four-carbon acid sugar kinase family protein [Caldilinea sp. CFX5]